MLCVSFMLLLRRVSVLYKVLCIALLVKHTLQMNLL